MTTKSAQTGFTKTDLTKLSEKQVAYRMTQIIKCEDSPKNGKLVNFQVRVAETANPSKTVDLSWFGVQPGVMPSSAVCDTRDMTSFNDTSFQSVTVFMNDTKVIGLSFLS